MRSYYHVEPAAPEMQPPPPPPTAVAPPPVPVAASASLPQFEVFDEEETKPARTPTMARPDTNAIAILANLLSKEHALSGEGGKRHLWVPAEEWDRVLAALRSFDLPAASAAPSAKPEPPVPKGPVPLCGWEDLGFEYLHA